MAAKHQEWKKQIELWRTSGMSARSWCRQHKLTYQRFLYWRQRLRQQKQEGFIEVEEEGSSYTGLSIESQGLTIQLTRDFDALTLRRLLLILRNPC